MTETCGCSTSSDIEDPLELRMDTVGPPIAGLELRIADSLTDEPLPPEARGEIQLRGPVLFDGYYKDPEKTAATFLDGGWMRTGDLRPVTPTAARATTAGSRTSSASAARTSPPRRSRRT